MHVVLARVKRRKGYSCSRAGGVTFADKSHASVSFCTERLPASAERELEVERQLRILFPAAPFHL